MEGFDGNARRFFFIDTLSVKWRISIYCEWYNLNYHECNVFVFEIFKLIYVFHQEYWLGVMIDDFHACLLFSWMYLLLIPTLIMLVYQA